MFHAALRASEICKTPSSSHTLRADQIHYIQRRRGSVLKISFSLYKYSPKSTTPLILNTTSDNTCPVTAYHRYLKVRTKHVCPAFSLRNNKPFTRQKLLAVLKHHLTLAGHNPAHYNTHSFRIGKTTDMASRGIPYPKIAMAGRWNSSAYLKYIKPSSIFVHKPDYWPTVSHFLSCPLITAIGMTVTPLATFVSR